MANPFFSGRIPPELNDRVNQYLAETGMGKTELLVEALAKFIGAPIKYSPQPSLANQLEDHEQRLLALEALLPSSKGAVESVESVGPLLGLLPAQSVESAKPASTQERSQDSPKWMTVKEAHEYSQTSLSLNTFRRVSDERLKEEFGLVRDYSRKPGRGKPGKGAQPAWIRVCPKSN